MARRAGEFPRVNERVNERLDVHTVEGLVVGSAASRVVVVVVVVADLFPLPPSP